MSKRALAALLLHNEVNLFLRGIIPTLGFKTSIVPYARQSRAAGKTDFAYSEALRNTAIVWNETTLDRWLAGPATFVPGTKMAFVGLREPRDRDDLIAFLRARTSGK